MLESVGLMIPFFVLLCLLDILVKSSEAGQVGEQVQI
jgi:hypothetical protein